MTERYFYAYTTQEALRRYIPYHNIGEVTGQIADYFGIKGYVTVSVPLVPLRPMPYLQRPTCSVQVAPSV